MESGRQTVDDDQMMLRSRSGVLLQQLRIPPPQASFSQSLNSAEFPERKRRNSFSHLLFNRQRASSEQFTSSSFAGIQRPGSAQRQQSKYKLIRLPFVGGNKEPSPEQGLLKLDDCFADIRLQLAEMAQESQVFRTRVESLSRGVSDLSQACQQQEQQDQETQQQQQQESSRSSQVNRSNTAYYPHRRPRDQTLTNGGLHYSASTLPLTPIERVQSQPSPLMNSWSCDPYSSSQSTEDSSTCSSFSQSSSSQLTTSAGSVCDYPGLAPPDVNVLVVDDTDSSRYSSEAEEEVIREQDDEVFKL